MLGFGKRKERKEMKKEMKQNKKDQKALEALAKCREKVEPKVVKRVSKQLNKNEAIEGVVAFGVSSEFYIVKTSEERYFVSGSRAGVLGMTKAILKREEILGLVNNSGALVLNTLVGNIKIADVLHPTMQDALYEEIQNLL